MTQDRGKFYAEMGFRLRQVRQARKVSQSDLAKSLGVVTQSIQKYESGEVRMLPEVIQHCARFFRVSVGYFYGEEDKAKRFSRVSLAVAAEVMDLPSEDLRKNVYTLLRNINALDKDEDEVAKP